MMFFQERGEEIGKVGYLPNGLLRMGRYMKILMDRSVYAFGVIDLHTVIPSA